VIDTSPGDGRLRAASAGRVVDVPEGRLACALDELQRSGRWTRLLGVAADHCDAADYDGQGGAQDCGLTLHSRLLPVAERPEAVPAITHR
jgi:hypothetical protein